MDAVDAAPDGVCAVGQLGQHAAADDAVLDQVIRLGDVDAADQGVGLVQAPQNAGDIGQVDQLVRADGAGDGAGCLIRVDVVGIELLVHAQRRDDRQVVLLQQVKEDGRIDVRDLADKADILPVGVFFLDGQKISVLAADADGPDAQLRDHGDQLLADAPQDHLGDLTGLGVGDAQAVDELRLLAAPGDPAADGLAAAVHDDGLEADQLEQGDVLDNASLQGLIAHGTPAVLDDDDLAVEFLNIGQRLDQDLCLLLRFHLFPAQIGFHVLPRLTSRLSSV